MGNDNKQLGFEKNVKKDEPDKQQNDCNTYNIDEELFCDPKIENLLVPIDIKQMPKIEAIRHKYQHELSQYSFNILYLWKEKMGYRVYIEDDFFVVKYDFGGENAWLFPCGAKDKIYHFICEKANEKDFRLCSLRDMDVTWLIEHFPEATPHISQI